MYSIINTTKNENGRTEPNINPSSFPEKLNLTTLKNNQDKVIDYLILLDKMEFLVEGISFDTCVSNKEIRFDLVGKATEQFSRVYKINYMGIDLGEIRTNPFAQSKFKATEAVIKVSNHLLYSRECATILNKFLNDSQLEYKRIVQVHIAIDSIYNIKIHKLLQRYFKSHTVQIGNDSLSITPAKFNKKSLLAEGINIGKTTSNKTATIYNKSIEIKSSQKDYIKEFWKLNWLNTEGSVYRFELKIKKGAFKVEMPASIDAIFEQDWLLALFRKEVENWLKIYTVKARDFKSMKKENALKKSGVIQTLFKWDSFRIPERHLELIPKSTSQVNSAKRAINFALRNGNSFKSRLANRQFILQIEKDFGLDGYIPFDKKLEPVIDWESQNTNFQLYS